MEPIILFENEDMLVVDKPAGLVVHADGRTDESSLTDWVSHNYPGLDDIGGMHTLDSGRYVPRMGILHRLDRVTSGVIMIAKNDETFYFFQRQFLDHSIEKIYNAFVHGVPTPPQGIIHLPIGRSRSDFRRWTTGSDARGTLRPATTGYAILRKGTQFSFVELRPTTGRTHQLRVHMRAIGHAILCDERYDSPSGLGFERLALHARTLVLNDKSGKRITFEAPFPPDFEHALSEL
jgi:23S rRNA pseudouridine1911/1915/1917 synthase